MNGTDAVRIFEEHTIDLALLDIKLPDIDGVELLKQFIHKKPRVPVIMISGFATIDKAVLSTKLGAYDFLEKPLEPQRVLLTIKNALEKVRLEKNQHALVAEMMARFHIVGVSDAMTKVCVSATRIAKMDTPVLITGENGTGKEVLASLIHQFSGRSPLACVNCAAVPRELIESELFGHRKGAFTGAFTDKSGKFQTAHGGTLLLDEIGDMCVEMQAKILRALETKEVTMIGSNEVEKVDVRVIAATNKNLLAEIEQKRFRDDLYFRLRGVHLHIQPLRERPEDIEPLVKYFISQFCEDRQIPVKHITDAAIATLQKEEWRGNVRELKHFIETLVIFSDEPVIDHLNVFSQLQMFTEQQYPALVGNDSIRQSTKSFEANLIKHALEETKGNITRAAARLHVDRATLSKKIKRFKLK